MKVIKIIEFIIGLSLILVAIGITIQACITKEDSTIIFLIILWPQIIVCLAAGSKNGDN